MFDVDIDVPHTVDKSLYGVQAIIYDPDKKVIRNHNSGRYFNTNIPIDKETGNSSIDYKRAEELGYIKVDLLNNTKLSCFRDMDDYKESIEKEPEWELLWTDKEFVKTLPQIGKHYITLKKTKPKSIIELAEVLALIRPSKVNLLPDYINDKNSVRGEIFDTMGSVGYGYKKSHAVAYAILIVGIMNSEKIKPIESFVRINRK